MAGSGSKACCGVGESAAGETVSEATVLGVAAVEGAVGLRVGAGLGFSTKATRVRAGVVVNSLAVDASPAADRVRVCIGPVRSV